MKLNKLTLYDQEAIFLQVWDTWGEGGQGGGDEGGRGARLKLVERRVLMTWIAREDALLGRNCTAILSTNINSMTGERLYIRRASLIIVNV